MIKYYSLKIIYVLAFACLIFINKGICSDSITINLHTDQNIYVPGEKIWVDGIVTNTSSSKYIFVELIDRNGIPKTTSFLYLHNSRFSGYLITPSESKTDFYFLRYALEKETISYPLKPLIIINPQLPPDICSNTNQGTEYKKIQSGSKKIHLNKKEFSTNEWVSPEFDIDSTITDISIYVRRKDHISDYADSILGTLENQLKLNNNLNLGKQNIKIKLSYAETGLPADNIKIWASVLGQKSRISYGISSEKGEISFPFPIIYGTSKIVFSVDETTLNKINIEMLGDTITGFNISFPCLKLTEIMREDIEERLLNVQIQEKYRMDGIETMIFKENDTTDFYGNAKIIYKLDDYVRFPEIKDIIGEIIPEIRIKNPGSDKPLFQILNQAKKDYFEGNALTLLDGVPIKNNKQLLNIDALKIKTIEVIDRKFYLGNESFQGIIHFKTYTNDLSGYELPERDIIYPFNGIQYTTYPNFEPNNQKNSIHLPDFKNLLYREIAPISKPDKIYNFKFITGNSKGIYKIQINTYSKEGKIQYYSDDFAVHSTD